MCEEFQAMRRYHPWLSSVLLLAFVLPAFAADEKKPDPTKTPKDKQDAYDKMVTAGELTGKLVHWGENSQGYLSVEVRLKYGVPNLGEIQALNNCKIELAKAAQITNAYDRQRRLTELQVDMAKHQANLVTYKEEAKTVDLQVGPDMKVRMAEPPVGFDEKGTVKKYTAKELKELKGPDPKLPGYTATAVNLAQDQIVTVYLAKKKDTAKPTPKDKDDKVGENRPQVTMILIREEPKK